MFRFYGGHSCYEGGHRAYVPPVPPLGKTLQGESKKYRPIHSMKFSVSTGDQLEYNGCPGTNGSD